MFSQFSPKQEGEEITRVDLPGVTNDAVSHERAFDPIELYLFQVEAKLLSLSPEVRGVVLEEIRQHLLDSVSARQELGMAQDCATQEAIARFGNPARIAAQLSRVWREEDSLFPRAAFSQALLWFGGLGGVFGTLTILSVIYPRSVFAQINSWIFVSMFFACPLIAGILVGQRAPRRAAFGTLLALAALMFVSVPLAWMDLTLCPDGRWLTPGFLPFLFTLWTLPGCLAASLTTLVTHLRRPKTG
ncbi:MAG: permease prefix domain 1-containing protein [Armatimonadota bacterium]